MSHPAQQPFPRLRELPESLPADGAVCIELEEGIPVFRTSTVVQARIEALLHKQQHGELTAEEEQEFDRYEAVDDYVSFLNRLVRNQYQRAA